MSETAQQLEERLARLIAPGARNRLLARGDARALVWRNGIVPSGVRGFNESLTPDLLDHGYSVLAAALRLRDLRGSTDVSGQALLSAAESIESAVRKGPPSDPMRGFHTIIAAASFHLARYAARSFCLVPPDLGGLNLSSAERALALLLRRNFASLRKHLLEWLLAPERSDETVTQHLAVDDGGFDLNDLIALSITTNLHRALGALEFALSTGEEEAYSHARRLLDQGCDAADRANHVPLWWVNTLARHLIDELWDHSLHTRLPPTLDNAATIRELEEWSRMRRDFIVLQARRKLSSVDLWPSQLEAARRAVEPSDDLVVALPTSAGKTRVAELCILRTLAAGRRVVYVTPLRALSAQIEQGLARTFRPLGFSVSALYGASGVAAADIEVFQQSDIVVATPEKLDFSIRQQPEILDPVGLIVLDEGHMIGLGTREVRYEVLVQRLLRRTDANTRRLVCLSAIFAPGSAFSDFTAWLRSDLEGTPIQSDWRPTRPRPATLSWFGTAGRLDFLIDEKPYVPRFLEQEPAKNRRENAFPQNENEFALATVKRLLNEGHSVLLYCSLAKSVETLARLYLTLIRQGYLSPIPTSASAETMARALSVGKEWLGEKHVAVQALGHGIAVHHGGLPRAFLSEVESLLGNRDVKVAIASPTLAQGIDLSCSALVLRSIYRGSKKVERKPWPRRRVVGATPTEQNKITIREPTPIPAEELANVMGRAGRAFVDLDGLTIFPIFQGNTAKGVKKKKDFIKLVDAVRSRQLKSGLVELVGELASRLQRHLGGRSWDEMEEYILNTTGIWDRRVDDTSEPWHSRPGNEVGDGDNDDDDDQEFAGHQLIDDLDTAILASVEQLDCAPSKVGEVLDEVLRSSLWRRHLEREPVPLQGVLRTLLYSRAQWLWERTRYEQRRAFFASGLGHSAGTFIDSHLDTLMEHLAFADENLMGGNVEEAIVHIIHLVRLLMAVPTFATKPKDRPDDWETVVAEWVRGTSLGAVVSKHGDRCVRFIQDGIVYRMVWALEAVRAHAVLRDRAFAKDRSGYSARALTYGAPSIQAALLLQAGLPSRSMTFQLLSAMPGNFVDLVGLRTWLTRIGPAADRQEYWATDGERITWNEFRLARRKEVNREWHCWEEELEVEWTNDISRPDPQAPLRLIRDPTGSQLLVCSPDLNVLGRVVMWPQHIEEACVIAKIGGPGARITARCFGPKAPG